MVSSSAPQGLLMVGLGTQGRPYLAAGRRLGLPMTVVDRAAALDAPGTRQLLGDDVRTVPLTSPSPAPSEWYAAARAAAGSRPPAGVVAFAEDHVVPAALLADELGLPGPGLRAAVTSRDKALQRALFREHGIAQPRWSLVPGADEGALVLAGLGRAVVKPTDGSGSIGVRLVLDAGQLQTWHEEEHPSRFLVEEYVEGPEYSVEVLVEAGAPVFTNVTAKRTTGVPHFVEVGHVVPAPLAPDARARVVACATAAVRALGMGAGIAHVELRLAAAGPVLVEAAVRTPGDHIMETIGAAWGTDLFEQVVRVSCGLPVTAPARPARVAEVVFPDAAQLAGARADVTGAPWTGGIVLSTVSEATAADTWTDTLSREGALVHVAGDHATLERHRRQLFPGAAG